MALPGPAGLCVYWAQEGEVETMKRRFPRRTWAPPAGAPHRPRVLIEDDRPALTISDFSLFERAGLNVGYCAGPGGEPASCPLLQGMPCPALAKADAVLHDLDSEFGIAAAIRRQHPGLPVVVPQHRNADGSLEAVPEGCLPMPAMSSVQGQIEALWRAVLTKAR